MLIDYELKISRESFAKTIASKTTARVASKVCGNYKNLFEYVFSIVFQFLMSINSRICLITFSFRFSITSKIFGESI